MTTQALFTLDLNRCTGCSACAVACTNENTVAEGLAWRSIHTFNERRHAAASTYHLSLACNHCLDPACLRGCPAAAYTKDPRTGAVLLNQEHCIGCGYCAWVCPYDAPQWNPATGVMEKCTFCSHRLDEGREPACVQACPVEALGFESSGRPTAQKIGGFPDTGLRPAIRFTAKHGPAPRMPGVGRGDEADGLEVADRTAQAGTPRLDVQRLRSEWPLLVFSLILTGMVAALASALAGGARIEGPTFAVAGLAAMAVSTLHLGRPGRAWRAVLNLRSSWVSREILLFSAFWVIGSAAALFPLPPGVTWLAAALGWLALGSVDLVYRIPGQRHTAVPHSAMTSLTALFLLGLMAQLPVLALLAGAVKLLLYPWRAVAQGRIPHSVTLARIGLGLVWPLAVWLMGSSSDPLLLVAGPAVAEVVDRARFYAELCFMSPGRRIALDAASS